MASVTSASAASAPDIATASELGSLPTDAISYADLYARWERGNWRATELDFSEDARQWRGGQADVRRHAAPWDYFPLFFREGGPAHNPSPPHDAAAPSQQQNTLATHHRARARA